jgi:hypothetical protein
VNTWQVGQQVKKNSNERLLYKWTSNITSGNKARKCEFIAESLLKMFRWLSNQGI